MSISNARPKLPPASDNGCDMDFTLESDYCTRYLIGPAGFPWRT